MAETDTAKLLENIKNIRDTITPGTRICAVVKADAYGHGAVEISRRIERFADCFAVALSEEGAELRLSGISLPILLLLPTDGEGISRSIRYGLTFAVDSLPYALALNVAARKLSAVAPVHIKINTGMNRFGFAPLAIGEACKAIKRCENLRVTGCFSHFCAPDDAAETENQFSAFESAKRIVNRYFKDVLFHISASGGIMAGRKYDLDMVRPGLLIYGYKPFKGEFPKVSPILTIKAKTLKTFELERGERLLYGNYSADGGKYSLVRAGYADGLSRSSALTANNRCMDVSALKGEYTGKTVVFSDAAVAAREQGTIPYEILCRVTARSNRIYKD